MRLIRMRRRSDLFLQRLVTIILMQLDPPKALSAKMKIGLYKAAANLQAINSPTWTVRRPRARREPPQARGKRGSSPFDGNHGDAVGLDALLRLADVAQNAALQQVAGNLPMAL